jgi:hypothetical protein
VVGFVPYENLAEAKPGTPLYRCTWGLVRCRAVGKVVAVLDGEVTEHHPHNGATKRGVMLELRLTDASAGQDDVLFAGRQAVLAVLSFLERFVTKPLPVGPGPRRVPSPRRLQIFWERFVTKPLPSGPGPRRVPLSETPPGFFGEVCHRIFVSV